MRGQQRKRETDQDTWGATSLACPMCGQRFDPAPHIACQSCPLQPGCQLVCCPACGYQVVDVRQSRLARAAQRFFTRLGKKSRSRLESRLISGQTLADIPPGCQAVVIGIASQLPNERRAHLLAYGLTPGRKVRVLQHAPVTIVQVEHTELALEADLARGVQVSQVAEAV